MVVVLLSVLEFCLMPLGTTVLDAVVGMEIGIDTVMGVTMQGLINLLVGIMSWLATLISWSLRSRIDGNIAPRPPWTIWSLW